MDYQPAVWRQQFWGMLGALPAPFVPSAQITHQVERDGYTVQRLTFQNGVGALVTGYLLLPHGLQQPAPAVLYHHFHGGKYHIGKDELFLDRLIDPPVGVALVAAGYVVLAIDAYAFGERQHQGPAGLAESGAATELSLFKQFLWAGATLWGMMLHDDLLALNYLATRPEVDAVRIAAVGMSMGGSRSTWLAALDERVRLTVPIAQMTRYQDFAEKGELVRHGIYYYVPGVLASGLDMEHLVALTAPRAQVILIGDQDPLSPLVGVQKIDRFAREVYGAGGAYEMHIYAGVGHAFTGAMLAALLAALRRYLG